MLHIGITCGTLNKYIRPGPNSKQLKVSGSVALVLNKENPLTLKCHHLWEPAFHISLKILLLIEIIFPSRSSVQILNYVHSNIPLQIIKDYYTINMYNMYNMFLPYWSRMWASLLSISPVLQDCLWDKSFACLWVPLSLSTRSSYSLE